MPHTSQVPARKKALRFGPAALSLAGVLVLAQQGSLAEPPSLSADAAAVFKNRDRVLVSVSLTNHEKKWLLWGGTLSGNLSVSLVDPDGVVLASAKRAVKQISKIETYQIDFPAPAIPTEKLNLRCRFGEGGFDAPVSTLLLIKSHETTLSADQEFAAGSPASLRCSVHAVRSLTKRLPLSGAEVNVRLKGKDTELLELYRGKTGGDGKADVTFRIPNLEAGEYELRVMTKSRLGEEGLIRRVKVKAGAKILLVTDKPLYQPAQVIHLRALALRPFDLKPVADADLVFEVEDPKGNKVFKRTRKTSKFGIAAIDFQLADELNMGAYQVRAAIGDHQAGKTVTVKHYVLPKSKIILTTDKKFYLPRETIKAELQTDYFFGKPVAGAGVRVTASTFDVQFREFQTWEGKTDENGHASFEIQLPDYFVGQPLNKGDAFVKIDAKVTDAADHTEALTRNYTVSNQPIRVSLIPESGRLVPDMENVVYAAAIYPDGSPAVCEVTFWHGTEAKGDPLATVQTNAAGLAELRVAPKPEQFRQAEWERRPIEMMGGKRPMVGGRKWLFDVFAQAKDEKGHQASAHASLASEPVGENVLLRLDKAIYRGGDSLNIDVITSAGLPTAYVDLIREGQALISRWLEVKDGKAQHQLALPPEIFGTLEVHAWQMLRTGEIIRDSRVIYVSPEGDLKISVKADKGTHRPGEEGSIQFRVTDSRGRPTPAALGVIIVDESVYALQDLQPGLEKVYFTLQKELLKPQGQIAYRPRESIDSLVREPELAAPKQQIAQVLLAAAEPKVPSRWEVAPDIARREKVQSQIHRIGWAAFNYAQRSGVPITYDEEAKRWRFRKDFFELVRKGGYLDQSFLTDPFGQPWDLDSLGEIAKEFTPDNLARAVTLNQLNRAFWQFRSYTQGNRTKFLKGDQWSFPEEVLEEAAAAGKLDRKCLKDAWGGSVKFVKVEEKHSGRGGHTQFDFHEFVSAGPDREFGTEDDIRMWNPRRADVSWWWVPAPPGTVATGGRFDGRVRRKMRGREVRLAEHKKAEMMPTEEAEELMDAGAEGGVDEAGAVPTDENGVAEKGGIAGKKGGAKPVRVRKYFPETMLWQPALITDDRGTARLPVSFADSITTWRLTASASSRKGLLGGVTAPLRVFQDFFIDLDLPVSLTQYDEVAFPVAVYNYLKEPQTVRLDLQRDAWFELIDEDGYERSLSLKPNEVTSVKFRIRAQRIGNQPLTVKAYGSKMSDAIRRVIEVAPDGKKVEEVVTDRLAGNVAQTINIPEHAVADASKILVKVYPGVFSQVMEGLEGMLRLPGG